MSLSILRSFVRKHRKSSRAKRVFEPFRPRFEMLEARNLLAVYYVDGIGGDGLTSGGSDANTGTSIAAPFRTLTKANSMVAAGDTVILRGGTYDDLINPGQNGTSGNKITYTNNANETVVINGKTGIQNGVSVNLQGRQNIVLDGLDLSSDELAGVSTYGVNASGSQNMEFRNLRIVNPYDVSQDFPVSPAVVPRGMNLSNAKNILVENVTISGWYIGLAFGGNSQFITIRNNVITNNIHHEMVAGAGNGTIRGHLIEGNIIGGSLSSDGFQTEGDPIEIDSRGMIFRNNYFFFNAENAIDLKSGGDMIIENNVFAGMQANNDGTGALNTGTANTATRGGAAGAVQRGSNSKSGRVILRKNVFYDNIGGIAAKDSDWILYNNTVVANNRDYTGWSSTFPDGDLTQGVAFVGMVVRYPGDTVYVNNIVTNNSQGAVWYIEGGGSNRLLDNNLYNDSSGNLQFLSRPGSSNRFDRQDTYSSLAAWKTYLTTQTDVVGKDVNSLEADPLFVNVPDNPFFNFKQADVFNPTFAPEVNFSNLDTWFPYDFSLQSNSPAIDAGRRLTSATNSGTNSTTLNVSDARFFFDGYGIADEGDVIQIGSAAPVRIAAIDYTTETITLEFARTWSDGDAVSLPYNGTAPDIGAFESGGEGNTIPIAEADTATTALNEAVVIDVLANDTDLDVGDTLNVSAVTQGTNGSVANNGTNVTYTPNSGFSGSDSFTYTVSDGNGGFDTATVNVTVEAAGSAFQQDSGPQGIVSIEAENFDGNTPRGGDSWSSVTAPTGFSGTAAMFVGPNDGDNINTGYSTTSPQLDYQINFVQTGTYYVWVLGNRQGSGNDDSLHIGLNGQEIASSDRITFGGTTSWAWTNQTMDGAVATFNVPATGVQTLNAWMREDGLTIDKIVLTTDLAFVPTGLGPAESECSAPVANADFDSDGDTDGADFLAWQRGFGTSAPSATPADGDADGDKDVDGNDLAVWQSFFGATTALLLASGAESEAGPAPNSVTSVPADLVERATTTWFITGADISRLENFTTGVRPLRGKLLGRANVNTGAIVLDTDAASRGWYDPNPWDDYESEGSLISEEGVDLLSVLAHEMGHLLDLDHDNSDKDIGEL